MARKLHRKFYAVRARHHESAARSAGNANDREGHREVARGYHKLSHGASAAPRKHHKKRTHKKKRGHR